MRSIGAISRASARASARRNRAVSKLHSKADSTLSALDSRIEKEIQRIERYEEKLSALPVKTLELSYGAEGWETAPLHEQAGPLTYSVRYKVPTQDVVFEPDTVDVGGIQITPRSISVSQYFTAIAFEATAGPGEGGRILKLVHQNKPESSRIALASPTGDVHNTLDTSLDGRIFAGTRRTGVVAFEPFEAGLDSFEILFEGSARKGAEPETLRIRVTSPAMREEMTACLGSPSILEGMTEKLRSTQQQAHADVAQKVANVTQKLAPKKASSGCVVLLAFWIVLGGLGCVSIFAR
jgi:hypothetical protein